MSSRRGRYHHGALRAALIDTGVELVEERGAHGFSLAEASRRLGVAASAPYAHFTDRDALLAAVAARAYEIFNAELAPEVEQHRTPAARLAAVARAYVRFAGAHRPLFELLLGFDKRHHPEIAAAEKPVDEAFLGCVRAVSGEHAEELATAVEATAHGHAMLVLAGDFGEGSEAVEVAADRAARATLALLEGRRRLSVE